MNELICLISTNKPDKPVKFFGYFPDGHVESS